MTDRKWCIRTHRALAQVGSKTQKWPKLLHLAKNHATGFRKNEDGQSDYICRTFKRRMGYHYIASVRGNDHTGGEWASNKSAMSGQLREIVSYGVFLNSKGGGGWYPGLLNWAKLENKPIYCKSTKFPCYQFLCFRKSSSSCQQFLHFFPSPSKMQSTKIEIFPIKLCTFVHMNQ